MLKPVLKEQQRQKKLKFVTEVIQINQRLYVKREYLATMVKLGSDFFPSTQTLLIRHCLQASVAWYGCYRLGIRSLTLGNTRKQILIRGVMGSFSSFFWYYSIKNLPLADVTGIYIYINKIILSCSIFLLLKKSHCYN